MRSLPPRLSTFLYESIPFFMSGTIMHESYYTERNAVPAQTDFGFMNFRKLPIDFVAEREEGPHP